MDTSAPALVNDASYAEDIGETTDTTKENSYSKKEYTIPGDPDSAVKSTIYTHTIVFTFDARTRATTPENLYTREDNPDTEVVGELGGMLSGNPASAELLERIAPFHDVGVPTLGFEHDVYVPCSKHRELVDSTGWVMSTQGSTVIRFVDDDVWDIAVSCAMPSVEYPGLLLAPLAAVALDLMPCSGARNRDAAWALMRHKEQILDAA